MENLELINGETKLPIKIKTTITGSLKSKLISIIRRKPVNEVVVKFQNALKEIDETEAVDNQKLAMKMLKAGILSAEDIAKYNEGDYVPDNYEELNDYLFDFFKEIVEPTIDFNAVKDDRAFWMEQDIEMIEREVNSFRSRFKQ
jgi:hypothetical protein